MADILPDHMDHTQGTAILKELSDIKANQAVNSNETSNIKTRLTELQVDIKEIKNDFMTRREFNEAIGDVKEENAELKKQIATQNTVIDGLKTKINTWGGALTLMAFVIPLIIYFISH